MTVVQLITITAPELEAMMDRVCRKAVLDVIAQKEDELARLKDRIKKQDAGQKIVIGGLVLSIARENPKIAEWLLGEINSRVTRKEDLKRIEPLVAELSKKD